MTAIMTPYWSCCTIRGYLAGKCVIHKQVLGVQKPRIAFLLLSYFLLKVLLMEKWNTVKIQENLVIFTMVASMCHILRLPKILLYQTGEEELY